ncbi:hypothetical protein BCR33DRAFT_42180 [Rhizoclosmatium globosum]|uniref:Uncharacterized protein n=1 Tax=Rhizoclosmatium globosum TaxID=329046 RepID=A0A1Y2CNU3_9FUNG|nr:hypothetical protein BCR33DRAFT_42180 [Rhizoclosmatium globosum]|eukprot:ORY48701.1 hypothetical protein BCR33DRAFT_42180 [Rhizoclosmatium globosum]
MHYSRLYFDSNLLHGKYPFNRLETLTSLLPHSHAVFYSLIYQRITVSVHKLFDDLQQSHTLTQYPPRLSPKLLFHYRPKIPNSHFQP